MGTLNGVVFYLAGSIDAAKDDGVGWRTEFIAGCHQRAIRCKVIDPTNKPIRFRKEIGHEKAEISELKRQYKWKEIVKRVGEFSSADLRAVDIADALVLYVDPEVHVCGSYFETERAFQQNKPMFLIVKGGRAKCPPWLFSKFSPDDMFDSVLDCLERLEKLNHSFLPEKWVLMKDWL
jgi:hypothetical protein